MLKVFSSDYVCEDGKCGKIFLQQELDPDETYLKASFEVDQDVHSLYILIETADENFLPESILMESWSPVCTDRHIYCGITLLAAALLFFLCNRKTTAIQPARLAGLQTTANGTSLAFVFIAAAGKMCIRDRKCDAGIMVTASHNPAKYNGYKAYGPDGCQMTSESADAVYAEIQKTDIFEGVHRLDFEQGMQTGSIEYISSEVIERYYEHVKNCSVRPDVCRGAGLKLVYTPLNGTGNLPVRRILSDIGIEDITVVPEQELPDGNFTTCPYPNPEIRQALELGLALAKKTGADLLLATDLSLIHI